MFHPEATDPLGALRWTIADVRRLLGDDVVLGSDPLVLELNAVTNIDLVRLEHDLANTSDVVLLEDIDFPDSPHLQAWLDLERYRIRAQVVSFTKERAIAALASGDPASALTLAERLVELDVRNEGHHALLVRALIGAGDRGAADQRADIGSRLLREDLGRPNTLLIDAARDGGAGVLASYSPRSVQTLVDAGRSAMGAGVPDAALRTLSDALQQARTGIDREVLMDALLALAEVLVHTVRGLDDIALDLLAEAEAIAAVDCDMPRLAAARRELGYASLLAADYEASDRWFDKAAAAAPDGAEYSRIQSYRGASLVDRGRTDEAVSILAEAAVGAEAAGEEDQRAFALSMLGRAYLQSRDLENALSTLNKAIEILHQTGWTSFRPFAEALLAEALLLSGRTDEATEVAEQGFVLACEIGDPCWEAVNEHSLALAALERGDREIALARLEDGYLRATRLPDTWWWLVAYILATLSELLVDVDAERAAVRVEELEAIAGPAGMDDLLARATAVRTALAVN